MGLKSLEERLAGVLNTLTRIEKPFCTFSMAFIILINIYGISSRFLFNKPVLYVQELTILSGTWLFFIGVALVFKSHGDITVDVLIKYFPHRLKMISEIAVDLLFLAFIVSLIWQTGRFVPFLHGHGESHAISFALEIPDAIYFYPIGIGAMSILLTVVHDLMGHFLDFRSRWKEAPIGDQKGGN
jgi:TRAP-type C4-dicarboxylate transport system permease small subunit